MASKRIQGITVEIGGDTSKLTAALKDVDRSLSTTQGNLRDINRLLKLDPGNTELLAQKHRLLGEAVKETKERLETLKIAAQQANEALAKGEITQNQYDALKREIIDTEEKLKKLETQANQSAVAIQKIGLAGDKLKNLGNSISNVGSNLMPVSAAVTGLGVAGLKVATDFEKAMSGVQAITGATGDEFDALREKAIDLGATTAFSSGEVAEAMTEMAKAGWTTNQIIDGMAGVLDATAASGENLGSVATIVADAITGFGLQAKDSARVADLLTQAANSGTIGITDLGESYKYVAPMAQSMGLSIEDVTTALAAMSMAGIKGSQAGTALRTVLANMTKPTDTVANAMETLGISIVNNDGSFKSLNEIVETMRGSFSHLTDDQKAYYATALAGKEGMSGMLSLLNQTQEEYDALSESMKLCTGIAGETASVMQDNLQSKLEQLGGALESLAIKLADHVIPFLTVLVERITSVIDSFTNLSPAVQKTILVIGGIVAAASPVLIVIGKVVTAIGNILSIVPKLASAFGAVKTAFAALSAVLAAHPIALVVAAVAGLIAIFVSLWQNCEGFRDFWSNLWSSMKESCITAFEGIKGAISDALENIKNFFSNAWSSMKDNTMQWLADTKESISSTWENIKTSMTQALSDVKQSVSQGWSDLKENTQEQFRQMKESILSTWSSIKENIVSAVTSVQDSITNAWTKTRESTEAFWGEIKETVVQVGGNLKQIFSNIGAELKEKAIGMWTSVQDAFQEGLRLIQEVAGEKMMALVGYLRDAFAGMVSATRTQLEELKSGILNAFSNIGSGVSTAIGNIKNAMSGVFSSVKSVFSEIISNAFSWGKDIIENMISGISSKISSLVSSVKNVASTIWDYLHFSEPEKGPLSDFHTYMPDMIDLLGKGITDNLSKLKSPMTELGNTLTPMTNGANATIGESGGDNYQNAKLDAMSDAILRYLPRMAESQIVLDSGVLVGELSDGINRQLGKAYV